MIYSPLVPIEEYWVPLNVLDIRPNTYEISSYGNIRRIADKYPIKAQILLNEYGAYRIVNLVSISTTKPKKYLVHRLVGIVFIPNPYNLPQINHINNNGMDETPLNLEWATPEYNTQYQETIKGIFLDNLTNYEIYRMIESGLSDEDIIDCLKLPVDSQYIQMIRESVIRNNPVSEYDFANRVVNSSKYPNDIIVKVCELFQFGMTHKDYIQIASIIGADISDNKKAAAFYMYCKNIYTRKHHTHISSNYIW